MGKVVLGAISFVQGDGGGEARPAHCRVVPTLQAPRYCRHPRGRWKLGSVSLSPLVGSNLVCAVQAITLKGFQPTLLERYLLQCAALDEHQVKIRTSHPEIPRITVSLQFARAGQMGNQPIDPWC